MEKGIITTKRLLLREYTMDDFDALYEIMSDAETMQHYPAPFDEARTRRWIEWNLENYARYRFGLWAVVLKETGEFIGDCGITIQKIDGENLPEIGYHIHKKYWRRGFAKEAALAVRDWAFENTDYPALYSYCKYTNEASYKTAEAIGMHFEKEYEDEANIITHVSVIHRNERITHIEISVMTYGHPLWENTISFAEKCSWKAGTYLAKMMREKEFSETERVFVATEGDAIIGYCTFAMKDELPDDAEYTPFIGFVFVDEGSRGKRVSERMINAASEYARSIGYERIYIMSGEQGLYEKYGFVKIGNFKTRYGTEDQLFQKTL